MLVEPKRRLVLIGGGHTHVQVLRRLVMQPDPSVHVTVVTDRPAAGYSGMIPGHVAGQYSAAEVSIDLVPLARRAGAAIVLRKATRIDTAARTVHLADGRPPLPWELCSINIGSTVSGLATPGVREHVVSTRPIHDLNPRITARLRACAHSSLRVVIVGGGAAGVELAFAMEARLRREKRAGEIVLIAADGPAVGGGTRGPSHVIRRLQARGITMRTGARVVEVHERAVSLSDGTELNADLVMWATGAAAHPLGARSGLPVDGRGFIQTTAHLEVVGIPDLFAAGDCAVLVDGPVLPRAGVYAVRSGPVLIHNLLVARTRTARIPFRPQSNVLALLNTCDGRAVATRGRWAGEGGLFFRLKDWIDRSFMTKFQVLDASGQPQQAFDKGMPTMDEQMACGGCAAKLADAPLRRALATLPPAPTDPDVVAGVDVSDDVAIVRHRGGLLLQTVDAFPAFTDDPFLVGRVAAVNAINDVFAKGATPRFALAVIEVPPWHGGSVLGQALAGIRHALDALGVSLVGGHTTVGEGLKVGLSITGVPHEAQEIWPTRGAAAGNALVLTRALGTGVLLHADMMGRATGEWVETLHRHLVTSNQAAVEVLRSFSVHAATDVTGFGLARHLRTMLASDDQRGVLYRDSLPLLPGVAVLLASGERSTFHEQNRMLEDVLTIAPSLRSDPTVEVVFDPQTAGGMLVSVDRADAGPIVEALRRAGVESAGVVGFVEERSGTDCLAVESGCAPA